MQSAIFGDEEPPELFRALVEQAPDVMIYADRTGKIRIWNPAAETFFGYTAAEVLGTGLDIIIPERFRSAHWSGYRRAMETGHTRHTGRALTTRAVHKDGSRLYVNLSFGVIKNSAGSVLGALAIGRPANEHSPKSPDLSTRPPIPSQP